MVFDRKLQSHNAKNLKLSLFTVLCTLGILSYSAITIAKTYNGPSDLSSQEFTDLEIHGPATLKKIKADSLMINGPLNFTELKIKGKTIISGPTSGEEGDFSDLLIHGTFWGSKLNIANLHVDGDVAIEDFKISGKVTINGPLKAKNGSFNDIDTVNTPVALYNVTVNNITVNNNRNKDRDDNNKENNNDDDRNVVKLAGNTVVSGNITFASGNGIVFIRDKTAQLKGKVIGGKIKEQ